MNHNVNIVQACGRLLVVVLLTAAATSAQIRPIYDQGALGIAQDLKRLNTTASVLMIGAHPDDEDSSLLTYLARGEDARTAYLSLTRGDGGQNLIGPELGEALGVIRTEELLQARRLDGAQQFFTRAYDYGFSKTLDEAKQKWDEKIILCDVVRVIRSFQPLVVVSVFSGTPADGHGQHQYAGYISPLAVKAAADSSQCVDTGASWTVKKFYVRHRGAGDPTLRINTGKYDPLLGRSYFEIAMQARSQHRSQEQGVLELKGDLFSTVDLVGNGSAKESGIFDGLNAANPGKPDLKDYDPSRPDLLIPALAERLPESRRALLRAAGVRIDVLADQETAVPGDSVPVAVRIFTPFPTAIKVVKTEFNFPQTARPEPTSNSPSFFGREKADIAEYFNIAIPADAGVTQPYWLNSPRAGDLFSIPPSSSASEPFGAPPAYADITLEISGKQVVVRRPVEYRYADDIRGEIRRELNIVPKVAVDFDKNLLVVSTRAIRPDSEISVNVTNNTRGPLSGKVRLTLPAGWTTTPTDFDFSIGRKGDKASVQFLVRVPQNVVTGSYEIKAEAIAAGETYSQTMQTIAYEHIQTHRIYRPAKADVKLIDLAVVPVKVGYIRGSGDRVPEAIKQLGLDVDEIDEATLATGDLSKFDTIVVGIRAYQVRNDVVSYNQRLLNFAKNGGTLIVQYQLPPTYTQENLAPFPAQQGPRVVDENAPIKILQPSHPIFNFPNKITAEDFKGWVQERNLYNFSTMDPKYVGLLESHDAGEPENSGGLVVADLGKGKYVYCSYSLFRQLPAGVPGAYRLLANMLSLPKAQK